MLAHKPCPRVKQRILALLSSVVLYFAIGALPLWASVPPPPAQAATSFDSIINVTSSADSGPGTLRQAITNAAPGDTIIFNSSMSIYLNSELIIAKNLTIDGSGRAITINGNNAGRVFYVNSGFTLNLSNVTVANGSASSGNGGGIYNTGTLNVTNSTFSGNRTGVMGSGGGIFNTGTLNVSNSTFSGSSAGHQGGGIYNLGTVTVINSTFSGGSAYQGGGIFNGGTFNVTNSIVANNTGSNCFAFYTIGGSNNLANDGSCGAGFTNSSAILLSALGNYGGDTPTLALLPGSAAIDAGNDAICAAAPVNNLDQRGLARSHGAHCDIGAFESRGFALTISGGNNQTTHTNTAFPNPLALNVTGASGDPVNGGQVTFTAPAFGASTNPATNIATIAGGAVSQSVTANATGGSYTVTASANGASDVTFTLTNTCSSAISVTNANDSGAGSLRQAIADVCGDGTITFNDDYMITLASALTIDWNMTIDGVGHTITVSGNNAVRVFYVHAGITFNLSNLTVANGNAGNISGGGIYNNGTLNVTNSVFFGNLAGGSSSVPGVIFGGGGIANYGTATVTDSTFSTNSATYYGGGILNYFGATLTVVDSTFATNGVPLISGGGIFNWGTATVTNSTFSDNNAGSGGGINNIGTLNVTNSTFSGNSVGGTGGGIHNQTGTTTVTNCTFSGNSASWGGGIYRQAGTVSVTNSIVANSQSGGNCYGTLGGSHNLANDASCGAGFTNSSAISLGALDDYGGNTQTFALLPTSVAIDAGDPAACPAADQRDFSRTDLGCDIGAFEVQFADSDTVIRPVGETAVTTFGPTLVGIRNDGGAGADDPGVITVMKSFAWSTKPDNTIDAYWHITPGSGTNYNLTLQLCYLPAELNGLNEAELRFWRYSGGSWTQVGMEPLTWETINGSHCAAMSGITGFSAWTLGGEAEPTAVTLSSFSTSSQVGWVGSLVGVMGLVGTAVLWRRRM